MDTQTTKTYRIPEDNLGALQVRMAKLIRRCNRIKVIPPVLTVGAFEEIRYQNEGGFDRIRRVYTVTLESAGRPKVDGFEFVAVISPTTDEDGKFIGNVLRRVPGFDGELPPMYRSATNYCDHCKTDRRRNETFVIYGPLAHGTGFKQIGRNCLANYLGLANPEHYAALAEILIDADELCGMGEDEGFSGGCRVAERVPLDEVLIVGASAIRLYGWLSSTSAREFCKTSTADRVREWVFGGKKARDNFEHPLIATDEDKKLATDATEWLEQLQNVDGNEYLYNLSLLAKAVSVTAKNFGLAVSAINAYAREKEFAIRRNAQIEADTKSEFFGAVGDRVTIENAVILYTTTFESQFGVIHFYKMKQQNNVIVYFSSRDMTAEGWAQGQTIPVMTARIKKHENRVDNYNPQGVKQTMITRVTMPKPPKPAPTPEQKIAKKAIAKLRKIKRTLPDAGQQCNDRNEDGSKKWEYEQYQAWGVITELIFKIQQEHKI